MFIEEDYDADEILREETEDFDDEENIEPFNELNFESSRNDDIDEIISDLSKENEIW
jgi:hypothetical protein